jgi:phenylpropionate dioxygenase-like ring-hydroxylating dioxygenase large terminal subunit
VIDAKRAWWPLCTSRELGRRQPLGRTLCDVPLVLFRDSEARPAIALDRCPHRNAPLSAGRVNDGEIECGYHGWRFDGAGRCTHVPGLEPNVRPGRPLNRAIASTELGGLVWACLDPQTDEPAPSDPWADATRYDSFALTDRVSCGVVEAAENFLDGFHTHFVHAGLIRRPVRRRRVAVVTSEIPNGVMASYRGEGTQSGLISRLFERDRSESKGRFTLPGTAEVEYRGAGNRLTLLVTTWLTPETNGSLRVFVRVVTPRGAVPGALKAFVLGYFFRIVLRQDKRILELASANAARFTDRLQLDSPLDVLAPHIRRLVAGEPLDEARLGEVVVLL